MSTNSKVMETQIQTSFNVTSSPQLTPRSQDDDSQDSYESYDREHAFQLEIKQLKRENKFLKKKIHELTSELNCDRPKKKKVSNKGLEKEDKEITHASIDFFFEEINVLLKSLVSCFKIQFTHQQVEEFNKRFPEEDVMAGTKKFSALKKFAMNRKLQKIMLENEEKRYPQLLEIFTLYYRTKEECDQLIRETVDGLSVKAQQLSKLILEKYQKRSLKNSTSRSHYGLQISDLKIKLEGLSREDSGEPRRNDNHSLPWTFSRVASVGSDAGEDPHKKRNQ